MKKIIYIFIVLFTIIFSVEKINADEVCEYSNDDISVTVTIGNDIDYVVEENNPTGGIVNKQSKLTIDDFSNNNEIICLTKIYYNLVEGSSYSGVASKTYTFNSSDINELNLVNSSNINNVESNNDLKSNTNNNIRINNGLFGNLDTVKCGNAEIPAPIPPIIRTIINFIKILTPLVLIIMGMIDMLNAVIASDEKKIKDAQSKFIRRLISAGILFFVVAIVQFIISIVADDSKAITSCISCMISDASDCIKVEKPIIEPNPGYVDDKEENDDNEENDDEEENEKFIVSAKNITFTSEYISGSGIMPYALYTPSTAKNNSSTPLIIWLHGTGEVVSKCSGKCFLNRGLPAVLNDWSLYGFNAYVLCPQASSYSWATEKTKVDKLINKIIKEKNINKDKIILVGHSMGGYGVYDIADGNANFYSALTVLSGYNTGVDLNQFKKIPIRGYVGTNDQVDNHMSVTFVNTFGKDKLKTVVANHAGVPKAAFTLDENNDNKSDLIEWMLKQ